MYEPIRNGRYFDATTELDELVASTDSSGGTMRLILRRLCAEAKRSSTEYQIINIQWESQYTHKGGFDITIQLTRDMTDYAFVLNQYYPFQSPRRMLVNGVMVSHEKYAALEALGRRPGVSPPNDSAYNGGIAPQPSPGTATPSAIGSAIGLCDEVKQELGRSCPRCLFCQLYGEGTWSPSKFLGTLVDEYLAVRADVLGAIRRGIGREKLMAYRVRGSVVLPEVIVDEILEWV